MVLQPILDTEHGDDGASMTEALWCNGNSNHLRVQWCGQSNESILAGYKICLCNSAYDLGWCPLGDYTAHAEILLRSGVRRNFSVELTQARSYSRGGSRSFLGASKAGSNKTICRERVILQLSCHLWTPLPKRGYHPLRSTKPIPLSSAQRKP